MGGGAGDLLKVILPIAGIVAPILLGPIGFIITASAFAGTGVLMSMSSKSAKQNNVSDGRQDRMQNIREPITSWHVIYGQTRVGGAVTFLASTANNQDLHMVLTIAGHSVDTIGSIYFNNELIILNDDSMATGRWANQAWVYNGTGTEDGDDNFQQALTMVGNGYPSGCAVPTLWTAAHKQAGRSKMYIYWRYNANLFTGGIPTVNAVVNGRKLFDPRTGQTTWSTNPALCIRDYLTDTTLGIGASSDEIDDASVIAAANVCEEYVTLANNAVTGNPETTTGRFIMAEDVSWPSGTPVYLTTTGSLPGGLSLGTTYFVINTNNTGIGATSIIKLATTAVNAVARTVKYFSNPGNGTHTVWRGSAFTADLWGYLSAKGNDTFALRTGDQVRFVSTGTLPQGLSTNTAYYWISYDTTTGAVASSLANALRDVNVQIFNTGSGTHIVIATAEQRYTCNGVFQTKDVPKEILSSLLSSMAGKLVWSGGKWVVLAGAWRTPTVTLDESDLAGSIKVTTRVSRRELFNGVKGTYTAPDKFWQLSDGPPVTNATYVSQDQGEKIWHDIHLAFTTSPTTFQRLAKIELETARRQISTTWVCKLTAMRVQAGDVVRLTNARFGWTQKTFEVIDWNFTDIAGSEGAPLLGVTLFLRETDANVYQWDSSQEHILPIAPATNLPDPFHVAAPANLTLSSGKLYMRGDGTTSNHLIVSWDPLLDAFVIGTGAIDVQYKPSNVSLWQTATSVLGSDTETMIADVQDGAAYDVRVRARNSIRAISSWTEVIGYTVSYTKAPPSNVTGFTATLSPGGGILLHWNAVADLDLASYVIRYGSSFDGGNDLVTLNATSYQWMQVNGTYTFWIKSLDRSGGISASAASATATLLDPPAPLLSMHISGANVILTITETGTGTFPTGGFEIRHGSSFASGTPVATTAAHSFTIPVTWGGARTFWVVTADIYGNRNGDAAVAVTVTIQVPSAPVGLAAQVFDNDVLLRWTGLPGSLPTAYYQVRRGGSFGSAMVIGVTSATFDYLSEQAAGSYTYFVAAVDTGGNVGPATSVTATVSAPPGYVLNTAWSSILTGDRWQVDHGTGYLAGPAGGTSGTYRDVFDYGAEFPGALISALITTDAQVGDGVVSATIETSLDGTSWAIYGSGGQIHADAFRYIAVVLNFASISGTGSIRVANLEMRIDNKAQIDHGAGVAVAGDTAGTVVPFTIPFLYVSSIVVTPAVGSSAYSANYDFVSVANPTSFKVFLFDNTGARVSGAFSWSAQGIGTFVAGGSSRIGTGVNLAGVAATGHVGHIIPVIAVPFVGTGAMAQAGIIDGTDTSPWERGSWGNQGWGEIGWGGIAGNGRAVVAAPIEGVAGAAGAGDIAVTLIYALPEFGAGGSAEVGNITAGIGAVMVGVGEDAGCGTIDTIIATSVIGVSGAANAGTLGVCVVAEMTGVGGIGGVGTPTPTVCATITGASGAANAGIIVATVSVGWGAVGWGDGGWGQ